MQQLVDILKGPAFMRMQQDTHSNPLCVAAAAAAAAAVAAAAAAAVMSLLLVLQQLMHALRWQQHMT